MKKLALVMVFVLLTALFIAFNYLLWDRESIQKAMSDLQSLNASNNASISAQNREIKSLEEDNGVLQTSLDQQESNAKQMEQSLSQAVIDRDDARLQVSQKVSMLNSMKKLLDAKTLEAPVREWVEALDSGKYDTAYELEYAGADASKRTMTLDQYTAALKGSLKRISLKSAELDNTKGDDTGEIYLDVILDVTLADNADESSSTYKNGQNTRSIKLSYGSAKNGLIISEISS